MNKTVLTLLLALVAMTAHAILPHPQAVLALDLASVFLTVGDTVEVTKDAALDIYEGVTFSGHGTSATINQLWPEVRKHYFVDKELYDKTMTTEDMPEWKQGLVKQMDTVIADIEADRLPLPAGTNAYVKEVIGASLLGEPMKAIIDYFRDHMTLKINEYYDFVAERERWLLDNPAMLLVMKNPSSLLNRTRFYFLYDIAFMNQKVRLSMANQDSAEEEAYKQQYVLPHDYDADLHHRLLPLREDTLLTIADYYRMAAETTQTRFRLKKNNIKGEHIYLTHTEWLQLCEKFQFNAVPFCLTVDKDGNIVTYDDLDK